MVNINFNPLSIANALIFVVTLAAIPATAAISSKFCSKVSFLVATGHILSSVSDSLFIKQLTLVGSFAKMPLVAGTPLLLWHVVPDVVYDGFLFVLTVTSPVLLAIEAAQMTRLTIRAGAFVLDVVERNPPFVSHVFITAAVGFNLMSGYVLSNVFSSESIEVKSASVISIVSTLVVVLGATVVIREEGSIIEVSLIGLYLTYVCWSATVPHHPPPETVGVSTIAEWATYLWGVLSFDGIVRLLIRTVSLLSLSVNLHQDEDEEDEDNALEDQDDANIVVAKRGWNNGLVNAICLCLYSHAVLQILDLHVYTVASWGPARVFQCLVALSLYVHTTFESVLFQ